MTTVFQHYKLFQHSQIIKQEDQTIEYNVCLEIPCGIPALSEAIPIEVYEAEQLSREIAAAEILQNDALKNQGTLIIITDILEYLSPSEIKQATLETISAMLEGLQIEIEHSVAEQRLRILSHAPKLTKD